jgi:2-hydroxychromene-2-carboxylate isomerase
VQRVELFYDLVSPYSRGGPVSEISRRIGEDPQEVLEGACAPEVKQALADATAEALERGVFGVPTFFVGDEMFWGNDRLHFVEEALQRG